MSEVNRFWSFEARNIRCVRECDFDDAQIQIVALREELSAHKVALREEMQDSFKFQQRLTSAEQRNTELAELLREVQKAARKQAWAHGYPALFESIDAALAKPTESGESK